MRRRFGGTAATSVPTGEGTDFPVGGTSPVEGMTPAIAAAATFFPTEAAGMGKGTGMGAGGGPEAPTFPFPFSKML
jgi:hypothetical protein